MNHDGGREGIPGRARPRGRPRAIDCDVALSVAEIHETWSCFDEEWDRERGGHIPDEPDPLGWIADLPSLCRELIAADPKAGRSAACLVLWDRWEWLAERIRQAAEVTSPSRRAALLEQLPSPVLGVLEGATVAGDHNVPEHVVALLGAKDREALLAFLVGVLRAARSADRAGPEAPVAGFDRLRERATVWLRARLATPVRAQGDWTMDLPAGCDCDLCTRLATFLSDADERRLEWPIAKEKRKHIHRRLDDAELPVRHETRRSGSPHTLVLAKTDALFEREAAERRGLERDLEWLEGSLSARSTTRRAGVRR